MHPVSNASVEKLHLMSLIKSNIRSLMHDNLLDSSVSIKYNGINRRLLPMDSPIFSDAKEILMNQKKRRFCS